MGNPDQEQFELLIDANVILEFLLARPRQEESLSLLKLTSMGSVTAWVMSYAVHSIEYMLYREGDLTALRNFLELLRSSMGLTVYDSSPSEDLAAKTRVIPRVPKTIFLHQQESVLPISIT